MLHCPSNLQKHSAGTHILDCSVELLARPGNPISVDMPISSKQELEKQVEAKERCNASGSRNKDLRARTRFSPIS